MEYKIIIADRANNDLYQVSSYISDELHAPQSALNLIDEIYQLIISLKQMPKKYALSPDERLAQKGMRMVAIQNYLIFYTVDENIKSVNVARILYGRRDWTNLL